MKDSSFIKKYGITYNDVIRVSNETLCSTDAAKKLNLQYKTYLRISKKLGCFKGNPGRKGMERTNPNEGWTKIPLAEILAGLHPHYGGNLLKKRLVRLGLLVWECSRCLITEWNGERIVLQLDHINGKNSDHRLENLRLLCPNCHSQTSTYSNKNNPN